MFTLLGSFSLITSPMCCFFFPDFFKVRCLRDYQIVPKELDFNGEFLLAFAVKTEISCNSLHLPLTTCLTLFTYFITC